ncbi:MULTISPECIES: UDP-N-acetylmuramoyl-L-alanyl-D-glutamate--2,6-diaminopimelate ligase [unclassified Carboxydocella]|uniref:UDP-N-acetylmuramoyl-L-alanyl-D-glutamate--2, 6-diaminopimelate ligase n=1 Tax=unclassified Carboxydocella TaxID=2685367 RepID=UPI0009AE3CAC|nr:MULTISPECIES: UDP-N-acetylmuramoyl-L-alanyl-D-glutamate--2,6-diaminopimelate ligase [unclassified Carboxydocella]GAW28796.1 UDP-N-acetylmuramoyl-L-alanyl-D-glutamate--2,6-diaminopimelate ligase [Carboxydocella sp. ULO1]GAW32636.1 UDP-N-acetylmuramoyl-L-alanyl-D-glutamate--2,6-diaminopimelate ligase [Carboxydocella sp. JDF658]
MILSELLQGLKTSQVIGSLAVEIKGIAHDSRRVEPGFLFVAIPGFRVDGHAFIPQALAAGAVAVVGEKKPADWPENVTWIEVPDSRRALAPLAARFYGYPASKLTLIGVTGTNGKTTTTHLVEAILRQAGHKVGLMGTIYNRLGEEILPAENTTPLPLELQANLKHMVERGASHVVMEVSSHGLDLGRVDECYFAVGIFTNLTQDHLDYHGTLENYRAAKALLFKKERCRIAVINLDDAQGDYFRQLAEREGLEVWTYGRQKGAMVRALHPRITASGVSFQVVTPRGEAEIQLQLTGDFNVYNALAALGAGLALGYELDLIKQALAAVPGVAGRFEKVEAGQPFTVIVDYAHTPDGLDNVCRTARQLVPAGQGRLITVFGCGGDRDRGKRPKMGAIAARYSDYVIITSDNPRTEDAAAILDEIEPGVREAGGNVPYEKIVDRRAGIRRALELAQPGDLVLIAGKGHETYQIIGQQVLPFDDRQVVREEWQRKG